MKPATLKDVAKDAGVSLATASFVLSGRGGAQSSGSEATKRKVRASAKKLGYVPNRYARAMRTGRSDVIILALGTVTDPWGHAVANAVRSAAMPKNLSTVILTDDTWSTFLSGYASDAAFVRGVDFHQDGKERLDRLSRAGVQVVAYSDLLEAEGFDVVSANPAPAMTAAFDMLRTRHESVATMTRRKPVVNREPAVSTRTSAFINALERDGDLLDEDVHLLSGGPTRADALKASRRLLGSSHRPTAVIAQEVYLAEALVEAAGELGIDVPGELEVIVVEESPRDQFSEHGISYFGIRNFFDRLASIIVGRAVAGKEEAYARHAFTWEFIPAGTTREAGSRTRSAVPSSVR